MIELRLGHNLKMSISKHLIHQIKRNYATINYNCVPKYDPVTHNDIELLRNFIENSRKIMVLTGAGISTESGIPDYRSEGVGLYARSNHRPVQYQEFLKSPKVRQRYWARNYIGWPRFSQSQPNQTHLSLSRLEEIGKISTIVTQNVDGLHTKAGSRNVIELHGTANRVICLACKQHYKRTDIQTKLEKTNPTMYEIIDMIRPDGDVDIDEEKIRNFQPPRCDYCTDGGVLKPDIIFFGDNVPRERVKLVLDSITRSDSLLILGSSLSVYSGYRFVLQAVEEQKPVCIVNIGPTRADKFVDLKISTCCGEILPKIV